MPPSSGDAPAAETGSAPFRVSGKGVVTPVGRIPTLEVRAAQNRVDRARLAAAQLDREAKRHEGGEDEESLRLEGPGAAIRARKSAGNDGTPGIVPILARPGARQSRDRRLVDDERMADRVHVDAIVGIGSMETFVLHAAARAALLDVGAVPAAGERVDIALRTGRGIGVRGGREAAEKECDRPAHRSLQAIR